MVRTSLMISLFILFTTITAWAQDSAAFYNLKFDLSHWPKNFQEILLSDVPELGKTQFSEEELNHIIKKVYTKTRLKKIKILNDQSHLSLQAELDSKVEEVAFRGTRFLSDDEAHEIINLNLSEANDVNKVKYAIDKLLSHYKNLGYQKASGKYEYENSASFKRRLIMNIQVGPKTTIQSLNFKGLNTEDIRSLRNHIYWNYVGEDLTDERLKKINVEIRSQLNARGLYLVGNLPPQIMYNADDTKVDLVYNFSTKLRYDITIAGTNQFTEYDLKTDVLKLSEYAPSDESFPEEILTKLQKFYLGRGYSQSDIKYFITRQDDKNILTYRIKENTQTQISQIKINGTLSRPEKFYIKEFYEYASAPVQEGLFIKADIEQAVKNLLVSLKNQGFINAKLKKMELTTDPEFPERGLILISIDEGSQATISDIHFMHNHQFGTSELMGAMELKDKTLLNLNEIELGLNKVRAFYANAGFLEMKIINASTEDLIQYSEDFSSAKITIDVFEGPQIYVGSILIDGNIQTHEKVIFSEIEFKTGDLLTPQKLEESTDRLQKTGLFSSIEIKMLESNTPVQIRTIVISLGERKPGILTVGAGVTNENDYTIHGYAGVAYRNIGGWGRGVSLRGEGSYNPTILDFFENKVIFGYLEPYLFDTRVRFRVNYTTSRTVSDYTIRQKTITNQAVWSVEQDITSHITGIWQVYNIANYVDEGISNEDEVKYGYTREDMVIASTGPTLDLDYRDNILNPTDGHFSRLSLEYASGFLGSNNTDDFLRATGQTTLYHTVYDQVVWANSVRGGYLYPLKTNDDGIRFDKKGFILGGRSTVRGFESTEFFPNTDVLGASFRLTGGSSYELFKSEFRFPLMKKSDLSGALFYDGGRVNIDDLSSAINYNAEWRDSVGIGIRYNLPIGPLNLEYAHKLNKKSYESDGAFHLSVGVF
jgi:outer membrane protein insertion porin family